MLSNSINNFATLFASNIFGVIHNLLGGPCVNSKNNNFFKALFLPQSTIMGNYFRIEMGLCVFVTLPVALLMRNVLY